MRGELIADIVGVPVPQGSKRVVRGRLIDANQQSLREWRHIVGAAVTFDANGRMLRGPLVVILDFYLGRPKHHFGSGKNEGRLKPSAPLYPSKTPDIDKLVRAVLDALTGVIFQDDSQVVRLRAAKYFASDERLPGVRVHVKELEP